MLVLKEFTAFKPRNFISQKLLQPRKPFPLGLLDEYSNSYSSTVLRKKDITGTTNVNRSYRPLSLQDMSFALIVFRGPLDLGNKTMLLCSSVIKAH